MARACARLAAFPQAVNGPALPFCMLNKFKRFLSKPLSKKGDGDYIALGPSEHHIDDALISRGALQVIETLQSASFEAYLVGGGVRDLLLDGKPKDFDVATSATPEEVKKLFRSARIIGRRFRIVHVRFGREIIEVTTFRSSHTEAANDNEAQQTEEGVLLRDNVYGDIASDAARRDFTVNALYYNPAKSELLNFGSSLDDLRKRCIRVIGDPETRYKEDPVRLLRAVRFAAKLGFSIEPASEKPIREHADYLSHIPAARLFEEVLKLFTNGSATATLASLRDYGLLAYLFPSLDYCLNRGNETDNKLVSHACANTDKRIRQGKRITPAFIYAAFLWPALRASMRTKVSDQNMATHEAMQQAAQDVVSQQLQHTAIPKRFLIPMREIWALQLRLPRRDKRRAYVTLEHPRFRAAYDFLLLREQAGEDLDGLGMWWTRFQNASEPEQQELIANAKRDKSSRPPRRRRRRKPKHDSEDA